MVRQASVEVTNAIRTFDVARPRIDKLTEQTGLGQRVVRLGGEEQSLPEQDRTPRSRLRLPSELAAMILTPKGTMSRAVSLASCRASSAGQRSCTAHPALRSGTYMSIAKEADRQASSAAGIVARRRSTGDLFARRPALLDLSAAVIRVQSSDQDVS
jgi:hypothetical protein